MPFDSQKFFNSPWTHMGFGTLSANRPGVSTGEAIGRGGLLGLQNYQQQQMAQARMQQLAQAQAMAKALAEREEKDRQRKIAAQEKVAQQYPELAPMLQAYPGAAPSLIAAQTGADAPASVREWEYFQKLSPAEKENYLRMKRSQKWLDLDDRYIPAPMIPGGRPAYSNAQGNQLPQLPRGQSYLDPGEVLSPDSPYQPGAGFQKGLPLAQRPDVKGQQAMAVEAARMQAKGEIPEREKAQKAKGQVDAVLTELATLYKDLDEMNAIVDKDESAFSNLQASASASRTGQALGQMLGTKAQSVRNQINQKKPLLINMIRQATGMGAKGMDSEKELQFYLQAATDETKDIDSNMAAISVLSDAYGLGINVDVKKEAKDALRMQAPTASLAEKARAELMRRRRNNGN